MYGNHSKKLKGRFGQSAFPTFPPYLNFQSKMDLSTQTPLITLAHSNGYTIYLYGVTQGDDELFECNTDTFALKLTAGNIASSTCLIIYVRPEKYNDTKQFLTELIGRDCSEEEELDCLWE